MKYQDFPLIKKSYLHRAQWRYYFYLSRVRILVSPWLLTWLANYKRASRSGARPVLLKFHSQNGFEVQRRYSYLLDELPNFHIAKNEVKGPEVDPKRKKRRLIIESESSQESTTRCYFKISFCCYRTFLFFIRILTFWNRKYRCYCLYFSFIT